MTTVNQGLDAYKGSIDLFLVAEQINDTLRKSVLGEEKRTGIKLKLFKIEMISEGKELERLLQK